MESEISTRRSPFLVIVAKDQADLQRYMIRNWAAHEGVDVVLDRRQGERRQRTQAHSEDRRGVDRRCTTGSELDLSCQGFTIIHRQEGGPTNLRMN